MMVKVSEEDDARFERELPHSMPAVYAVADHLRSFGTKVEVICAETFVDRAAWEDRAGDLLADGRITVEVKHRRDMPFTCRNDFPFPTLIIDRPNKKSGLCDLYVSVNKNLTVGAFVSAKTKQHWIVADIEDHKRGYPPSPRMLCPLEHVRFVALHHQRCHCGEYGCYSPNGRDWLCPEHSGLTARNP